MKSSNERMADADVFQGENGLPIARQLLRDALAEHRFVSLARLRLSFPSPTVIAGHDGSEWHRLEVFRFSPNEMPVIWRIVLNHGPRSKLPANAAGLLPTMDRHATMARDPSLRLSLLPSELIRNVGQWAAWLNWFIAIHECGRSPVSRVAPPSPFSTTWPVRIGEQYLWTNDAFNVWYEAESAPYQRHTARRLNVTKNAP